MLDNLVRDLQVLQKADTLIGKIWMKVLVQRIGLITFAGLIAVFGLGMANVAGFYALQKHVDAVWAAAIVAAVDFVIAIAVLLIANHAKPGAEIELALDVRKMAVDALQADARELKSVIETIGRDVRDAKLSIAGFMQHPLDAAAEKLLIPAVLSIVRGLRHSKKEQG